MSATPQDRVVGVCIPTLSRPISLRRVLDSLSEQELAPATVLVMHAGDDPETQSVCKQMAGRFAPGVVRHVATERGLTRQRRRGIELLRSSGVTYACMLDDDVTLEPNFLSDVVNFLASQEGREYGGISGYNESDWGTSFDRLERIYSRLRIYDGELRPGRWLFCGRLLTLNRLSRGDGVLRSDFLPGGHTVWKIRVFDDYLPPSELDGYALYEDVHFSLRVATRYELGVMGNAVVQHHHAPGGRPKRVGMALTRVRRLALLLRDCDPKPTLRRYAAFLGVTFVDILARAATALMQGRAKAVPGLLGSLLGWLSCVLAPPRPTRDALVAGRASRGQRARAPASEK